MDDIKWFARTAERLPDKFWVKGEYDQGPVPRIAVPDWIHRAHQAPIGRGPETLIDEEVRKSLEVKASEIKDSDMPQWSGLNNVLQHISKELTPGYTLVADFYKLLIYRPGDYFKAHRDSKKGKDHIITLSVVCDLEADPDYPPCYNGGDLIFTDGRGHAKWDRFSPGTYAAWFNTEEHEVTPADDGFSAVLTYNVSISGVTKPMIDLTRVDPEDSHLLHLPADVFPSVLEFCAIKDQLALSRTCWSARNYFEGKSFEAALFAEKLRVRQRAILYWLHEGQDLQTPPNLRQHSNDTYGRNTTLAVFLKHEYSFDGKREINPSHLRGSDALMMQAVKEAFPEAICSTREAFLHYKRSFSEFENAGELNVIFGENDLSENLKIVQAITPTDVWKDAYEGWGERVLTVKEEYRHLLPAKVSRIFYGASGLDADFESTGFCFWPFFRTFFAIRPEDKKRVFRHRNLSGKAVDHDLGNEGWQSEATWYRSACLLIHFPQLEEELEERIVADRVSHEAEHPDNYPENSFDENPDVYAEEYAEEVASWEYNQERLEEIDKLVVVDSRYWEQWLNAEEEY